MCFDDRVSVYEDVDEPEPDYMLDDCDSEVGCEQPSSSSSVSSLAQLCVLISVANESCCNSWLLIIVG